MGMVLWDGLVGWSCGMGILARPTLKAGRDARSTEVMFLYYLYYKIIQEMVL
jgi:hypothetical protein